RPRCLSGRREHGRRDERKRCTHQRSMSRTVSSPSTAALSQSLRGQKRGIWIKGFDPATLALSCLPDVAEKSASPGVASRNDPATHQAPRGARPSGMANQVPARRFDSAPSLRHARASGGGLRNSLGGKQARPTNALRTSVQIPPPPFL